MMDLNFFSGKDAVLDFLNPSKSSMIPLVEVPAEINPFYEDGVRIYAKLLNMLPLSNVKSLPAFNMLDDAKRKGRLEGVESLVESSSGNTVFSLSVLGRLMGVGKTEALVSNEISAGKLKLLRLFGADVVVNDEPICPDPTNEESVIYKARDKGKKDGWFNAGQYENDANPNAHEKVTAKQIWEQLKGDIQIFLGGLGDNGHDGWLFKVFQK